MLAQAIHQNRLHYLVLVICVFMMSVKKEFEKLNIRLRIDKIKRTSTDRQIIRYADRVINKLND